jgi:SAM-dependent methyltransferase
MLSRGLNFGRRLPDELGNVSHADDDRVDSRSLQLHDLLARHHGYVCDGELARRNVREEVKCALKRLRVRITGHAEQEDLGIEPFQRQLELLVVVDLDDAIETEVERGSVRRFEPVAVFAEFLDDDEACVRAGPRRVGRSALRAPENGELGRVAQRVDRLSNDDRLRTVGRGSARIVSLVNLHEHRDPVPFRDRLAEAACCHPSPWKLSDDRGPCRPGYDRAVRRLAFRRAPASYDEAFVETMAAAYLEQTPWTRLRLEAIEALVEPKPGDRVLDLGCAAGALTDFLSRQGCEVVGVDSEARAIAKARSLFPELRFVEADVAELPFAPGSFDKAVAGDLVEHLDDATLEAMLGELRRVLVPRGTLSIYTPNPLHVIERLKARNVLLAQNPTHIGLRSSDQLEAILERNGFTVERNEWRPSFFHGLRPVERLLGPRVPSLRYRLCLRAATRA